MMLLAISINAVASFGGFKPLPNASACSTILPGCKLAHPAGKDPVPNAACTTHDACWPGQSLDQTPDHTCDCFATSVFCKEGDVPVYTPGKKCPSCWPTDNHACDCFASIGFCNPPAKLPETSECSTLCPGCELIHPAKGDPSPNAACVGKGGCAPPPAGKDGKACWPGHSLNQTVDHNCDCFVSLGFCAEGEAPVYPPPSAYPGKICPSCWPRDNHACDCFAVIPFCNN